MFTSAFWRASIERAVKTAAQAAATVMTVDWADWFAFQATLEAVGGSALVAALFSLLTSIASAQVGAKGSPSLAADAEVEAATQ